MTEEPARTTRTWPLGPGNPGNPGDPGGIGEMDPVERIMAACFEAPAAEWSSAIDAACGAHPDLADEIRARFCTLRAMGFEPSGSNEDFPPELGHFELLERLGGGGMGVVYRATDSSLGREVALKLIRPEILYFEHARERFRREVEAVARLQHPSIISIFSVGEEHGIPYFAMELLEGRTIAEVLRAFAERAPGSLSGLDLFRALGGGPDEDVPAPFRGTWVDACLALAIQIARALEHAHGRDVLHRDIKPSNVMLLRDGRAILLDFGLASSAEVDVQRRVTQAGSPVGTLFYMSPEQVVGKPPPDRRTDVYSLGVTLYEMLTLQVPYAGDTPLEIQTRILAGEVDPIQARNRRVPTDVITVCRTAMRRYAAERYASAAAFADDLVRARDRLPIQARPPRAAVRALRWMQRNRAATVAVAALLTFAVGLPTGLLVQQRIHAAELGASLAEAEEVLDFTVSMLLDLSPQQAAEDNSARGLLERGMARLPGKFVHNPRGRAKIQSMIGRVLFFWNDYEAAIPPLEGAIETLRDNLRDAAGPAARHELVEALETLGIVHANLGRFEEADRLLLEAVELAEEVFGPDEKGEGADWTPLATAHVLRAESFQMQNRLPEALEAVRVGLDYKRRAGAGPESLATTVGLLSTILQQLGRDEEAAGEMEQLHETLAAAGTPDSVPYANFLSSFAFLRMGQERYPESAQLYRQAIDIESRLLGASSPTVADSMSHYARMLSWSGDHEASLGAWERTVEIARSYGTPRDRDVLHSELRLAQELVLLGRHDDARAALEDLLPRMRDTLGEDDRWTGFALEGLGRCYLEAGELDAAEECLLEAYDLLDRVRSEAEQRVAVRAGLFRIYRSRGEDERALELLEEALEIAPWAVRQAPVREALLLAIDFHTARGNAAEAKRCDEWLERLTEK